MRSPVNIFLTGLSLAQFLLATNYIGLLVVEQVRKMCYQFSWTSPVTFYKLFNVNASVIFHTTAFMHTLALAIFRTSALRWPLSANRFIFSNDWAIVTSITIWTVVPFVCFPVFFSSRVTPVPQGAARTCQLEEMYDLTYADTVLVQCIFWVFGIVLKLLPCVILVILLLALIRSLQSVESRRQEALRKRSVVRGRKGGLKTTHALVAILVLCSLVELPHGILNLCTAINGQSFAVRIYDCLGPLLEMLTLLYSSVNFVLYCIMSNEFLTTFRTLFLSAPKEPIASIPRYTRSMSNIPRNGESMVLLESTRSNKQYPTILVEPRVQ
ncbi:Thyrotropin-releasing hormone receptor [Aphelenchoides fujianensis]|nr:Thyrotropin-releasing hormone receptor [Aphelenchoides fujianensis]